MASLDWVPLDHSTADPVQVGDVVSVEAGGMPIYQVMAVAPGQAWLGDERKSSIRVMPLDGFRWKSAATDEGSQSP